MLQMLSLDVADTCCWVLQTLIFNVADVEFRCCRHVMFDFVSRRRGGERLMLDVARNTGRNMVATLGEGEERLQMLDVARNRVRNIFATRSQHARSIYSVDFRSNG
jgi:hypothetical protein